MSLILVTTSLWLNKLDCSLFSSSWLILLIYDKMQMQLLEVLLFDSIW